MSTFSSGLVLPRLNKGFRELNNRSYLSYPAKSILLRTPFSPILSSLERTSLPSFEGVSSSIAERVCAMYVIMGTLSSIRKEEDDITHNMCTHIRIYEYSDQFLVKRQKSEEQKRDSSWKNLLRKTRIQEKRKSNKVLLFLIFRVYSNSVSTTQKLRSKAVGSRGQE